MKKLLFFISLFLQPLPIQATIDYSPNDYFMHHEIAVPLYVEIVLNIIKNVTQPVPLPRNFFTLEQKSSSYPSWKDELSRERSKSTFLEHMDTSKICGTKFTAEGTHELLNMTSEINLNMNTVTTRQLQEKQSIIAKANSDRLIAALRYRGGEVTENQKTNRFL